MNGVQVDVTPTDLLKRAIAEELQRWPEMLRVVIASAETAILAKNS